MAGFRDAYQAIDLWHRYRAGPIVPVSGRKLLYFWQETVGKQPFIYGIVPETDFGEPSPIFIICSNASTRHA